MGLLWLTGLGSISSTAAAAASGRAEAVTHKNAQSSQWRAPAIKVTHLDASQATTLNLICRTSNTLSRWKQIKKSGDIYLFSALSGASPICHFKR
jgi:hypothetical protein